MIIRYVIVYLGIKFETMKVTALIPDELIEKVKRASGGKNITESLMIALTEYLQQKSVGYLQLDIEEKPLELREGFTAYKARNLNRSR